MYAYIYIIYIPTYIHIEFHPLHPPFHLAYLEWAKTTELCQDDLRHTDPWSHWSRFITRLITISTNDLTIDDG